jgi:hypothetical protein
MNALLIVGILVLGGLVLSELGFRLGRAFRPTSESDPKEQAFDRQLDVIRTATSALVAFLIGFAFAGAGSRFIDRSDIIVKEANALGTAWLRADVLPEPQRGQLKAVLKEYTADRVTMLRAGDSDETRRLLDKVGSLHERIWTQALAGLKDDAPRSMLVLPALNDVIDLHTTHWAMVHRHLPPLIFIVLLGMTGLFLLIVGYGDGRAGTRSWYLTGLHVTVLSVALWMTIDLDQPRQGLIRVNISPIVDTLASMR